MFKALAYIILFTCIVQASSASKTMCISHHFFMVLFLSEMNYLAILVDLFFQWKKQINKTYQKIYFTNQKFPWERFTWRTINVPEQQALILLSMIILPEKLLKMFLFVWTNSLMHVVPLVRWLLSYVCWY